MIEGLFPHRFLLAYPTAAPLLSHFLAAIIMNNLLALGAQEVIIGEMALMSLALATGFLSQIPQLLPTEVLFPAHVLYCLLTYVDRSPESHWSRKLIASWLYAFGDIYLASLLGGEEVTNMRLFTMEFLVIFIVLYLFPVQDLRGELSTPWLRGLIYQLEAIYKSNTLLLSLSHVIQMQKGFTLYSVSQAMLTGVCRLCSPVFVFTIERVVWSTSVDSDLLVRYLRLCPVIVGSLLYLLYKFLPASANDYQVGAYTPVYLVANLAFLAWYSNEAVVSLKRSK